MYKEKVFLIGRVRLDEKEIKSPGREATLRSMKLIVANARIITPSFCRPPEECSRGINLRQLAVSWPRAKRLTSPILSPTPGWVLDAPFCLVALLLSPPGPGERSADPADPAPQLDRTPTRRNRPSTSSFNMCAASPCPSSAAAHSWPGSAPHPPPATGAPISANRSTGQ